MLIYSLERGPKERFGFEQLESQIILYLSETENQFTDSEGEIEPLQNGEIIEDEEGEVIGENVAVEDCSEYRFRSNISMPAPNLS